MAVDKIPSLDTRALRRIGRRNFIIVLGPLAATWDGAPFGVCVHLPETRLRDSKK